MQETIKDLSPLPVTPEQVKAMVERSLGDYGLHRPAEFNIKLPPVNLLLEKINIDDLVTDGTLAGYRLTKIHDPHTRDRYKEVYRHAEGGIAGSVIHEAGTEVLRIIAEKFEKEVLTVVEGQIYGPRYILEESVTVEYDPDFYIDLFKKSLTHEKKPRLFPPQLLPPKEAVINSVKDFFQPLPWAFNNISSRIELLEKDGKFVIYEYDERGSLGHSATFETLEDAHYDLTRQFGHLGPDEDQNYFCRFDPYIQA